MYLRKGCGRRNRGADASEKHWPTRIGTVSKPELAQSQNGTPVTFACRQRFITLHQPLETHAAPEFDRTRTNLHHARNIRGSEPSGLGSSGKGIRDGWDETAFSREIRIHCGLVVGGIALDRLRRRHECRRLGNAGHVRSHRKWDDAYSLQRHSFAREPRCSFRQRSRETATRL